jgi:hypothetical protein
MERQRNIHGGGANTNKNGLLFESNTDIFSILKNQEDTSVDIHNKIYKGGELIGQYCEKNDFYELFLKSNYDNMDVKTILSKCGVSTKKLPDAVFINFKNNTVYIFEKKFQTTRGSVDEKLGICEFLKWQYNKLCSPIGFNVELIYLLNDWFDGDKYKNFKEFMVERGHRYYVNDLPAPNELGL